MCAPLISKTRGNITESTHFGDICIVDEHEKVIFEYGSKNLECFTRSALKPFQIVPLLEEGGHIKFDFTEQEIAIMCGSHNGEDIHVKVVQNILNKIGLTENSLLCGPQYPTHRQTKQSMLVEGKKAQAIHNNCSGKHAGFLAYCVLNKLSFEEYLSPKHPLQIKIKNLCAEFHGLKSNSLIDGIDGCSAPNFACSIERQAIAYKRLLFNDFSIERKQHCNLILKAIQHNPLMLAGTDRYCTELVTNLGHRVLGKTGADGVFSMLFLDQKLGCTIKIADGRMGPQYMVAQTIVDHIIGAESTELSIFNKYRQTDRVNWNRWNIGQEIPATKFKNALEDNLLFN